MPKLPRVNPTELVRALLRAGFEKDHQKGSHLTLLHPDGRRTVVAMHPRDLPAGTLHAILKQAGVATVDFERLLK